MAKRSIKPWAGLDPEGDYTAEQIRAAAGVLAKKMSGATADTIMKREIFCQRFVETGNASRAYREAYNSKSQHAGAMAHALMQIPEVAERIEDWKVIHGAMHCATVESLLNEYEEARVVALTVDNPSAAVAAITGKARILGLDKEVKEHTGKGGEPLSVIWNFVKPKGAEDSPLC